MLTACAVGPDFQRPEAPGAKTYTSRALPSQTAAAPVPGGVAQQFKTVEKIPRQWWQVFHSDALDRLIRLGLADNPSTAAAQAALRQARELVRAQYGTTWFPALDAHLSAGKEHLNGASFGQSSGGYSFELYNASVGVTYLLDLFGAQRRQLEALRAQADYQGYQLQGTYLALTANIVTSALQEASLRAQLQATREIIDDQQKAYELVQQQFRLGGVARTDVLAQQTQLAQTRATLPPLEKALSQTRHQLAVLVGRPPGEAGTLPQFEIQNLTLPAELPVTLPSSLVRQRPDIQAAESLLHAAGARVGVATANLYPNITLTGTYGSETNQFGDLFHSDTMIWNFGAGLLQPLFHGGALRADRRAAEAACDQAAALYRQTVLQAFLNVADVLRSLEADARALKAEYEAETAAGDALALTRTQFRLGAVSYLSLLNAQRQYQQTRIGLIQAQAARFADTAALFQALGGGWRPGSSLAENTVAMKNR